MRGGMSMLGTALLLWAVSPFAFAGDLVGRVVARNGTPAANVTINLIGPGGRSGSTNANGFYAFRGLPGGDYTLKVQDVQIEVRVPSANVEIRRDLVL